MQIVNHLDHVYYFYFCLNYENEYIILNLLQSDPQSFFTLIKIENSDFDVDSISAIKGDLTYKIITCYF